MTDENAIVDAFVAAIKAAGISGLKTVEAAAGGIDEIVKQLRRHPSVVVIMGEVKFDDGDESGDLLQADPRVDLLVAAKSLRSQVAGQQGAYDILKACRQALHNTDVGIAPTLWKVSEQRPVDFQGGLGIWLQRFTGFNVHF